MKLTKQTVLFPFGVNRLPLQEKANIEECMVSYKKETGYFFTPEQVNQLLSDVIKDALDIVDKKLYETFHTVCEDGSTKGVFKTQKEALDFANILNNKTTLYHDWVKVVRLNGGMDKKSITNTFEETFNKFKV
jgi:hypothetical protein